MVEWDPEQMNEMIGGKTAESRSRSLQHYQPGADGKKSLPPSRTHTTCDSIYVVDNRIKADVHRRARACVRARPPGDRLGDGVFAVMSLGNWTPQEPNNRIIKLKEMCIFETA